MPIGTHPSLYSGLCSPNYTITFVPGYIIVSLATLTVTVADAGKVYGAANPVLRHPQQCEAF
jgi:hypothetical protein